MKTKKKRMIRYCMRRLVYDKEWKVGAEGNSLKIEGETEGKENKMMKMNEEIRVKANIGSREDKYLKVYATLRRWMRWENILKNPHCNLLMRFIKLTPN